MLSAWQLGDIDFALGATMATTKARVAAIGGWRALVNFFCDDYELGNRIARSGYRVELSPYPVCTVFSSQTLGESFRHQVRWNLSLRYSRPLGHFAGHRRRSHELTTKDAAPRRFEFEEGVDTAMLLQEHPHEFAVHDRHVGVEPLSLIGVSERRRRLCDRALCSNEARLGRGKLAEFLGELTLRDVEPPGRPHVRIEPFAATGG